MFAGIDIGSVTTKAVIINQKGEIETFVKIPTLSDRNQSGEDVFKMALNNINLSRNVIQFIVSTGYGRRSFISSNKALPEIICHAKGTISLYPHARTILDIGGQDSKAIELDEQGNVSKFEMNDKCAAGTGRFLEVLTERILNISLDELGPVSLKSQNPCILSSVCTVFAESEIISLLSEKRTKEDIAYGLHRAIAKRVISMGTGGSISFKEPIIFSGGVAKNIGVLKAIEDILGKRVITPEEPQITAALGAAIFARESSGSRA
jgi:(R)-2-hydroxyacyl-CoA dehydratese activating ATPase